MNQNYKRVITIDVERNEDGSYDTYIATESSSGSHYPKITADEIGEDVADLIECLYEEQEKQICQENYL